MKSIYKLMIITIFTSVLLSGCEDYLDVPPDATLTENDVFSSYATFQGFLDPCYSLVSDPNNNVLVGSANMGTEAIGNYTIAPSYEGVNLEYWKIGVNGRSIYAGMRSSYSNKLGQDGLWDWWPRGCRIANIGLANLDLLTDATQEEKDKLEGQARFFRAYLNFMIANAYGTIPYLDELYTEENLKQPRHWTDEETGKIDYQAVSEKAARDLQRAAELLPEKWEDSNLGRITKGAAYGLLAKVLLYAGSPLMNEVSGGPAEFDKEYMQRAAEAAAEVIKLANKGVYALTPWGDDTGDGYRRMYTTIDGNVPATEESIFQRWVQADNRMGVGVFNGKFGRVYSSGPLGGNAACDHPLLKYMDKFEMNDGTQYKPGNTADGGYDDDLDKFQNQRDPRFDYNFRLHGETIGNYTTYFHNGGTGYYSNFVAPFMITKYYYPGADKKNNQFGNFMYYTPLIRLAGVYLTYAEAVFEATGDPNASIGGAGISAVEAVNLVRNRVNMPSITASPAAYSTARTTHGELASDHPFRLAVRNERCVELAYEAHYWCDLRRWKRSHLLEKQVWRLYFDKDYTSVSRDRMQAYPFEMKHYWLPFPTEVTQIYEGWEQNPGW